MHGVELQHIGQIIGGTQIVDAHDLNFGMMDGPADHHASDTAEAIDANLNAHLKYLLSDGIYQTYGTFCIISVFLKNATPNFQ